MAIPQTIPVSCSFKAFSTLSLGCFIFNRNSQVANSDPLSCTAPVLAGEWPEIVVTKAIEKR